MHGGSKFLLRMPWREWRQPVAPMFTTSLQGKFRVAISKGAQVSSCYDLNNGATSQPQAVLMKVSSLYNPVVDGTVTAGNWVPTTTFITDLAGLNDISRYYTEYVVRSAKMSVTFHADVANRDFYGHLSAFKLNPIGSEVGTARPSGGSTDINCSTYGQLFESIPNDDGVLGRKTVQIHHDGIHGKKSITLYTNPNKFFEDDIRHGIFNFGQSRPGNYGFHDASRASVLQASKEPLVFRDSTFHGTLGNGTGADLTSANLGAKGTMISMGITTFDFSATDIGQIQADVICTWYVTFFNRRTLTKVD